ncbi:MAG: helix-turn-helix transcriptional regulator [Bacteroidota bacterium]
MHLEDITLSLKRRRELLGVTQEQLSDLSGVGLRTLKALERNESNPTFETLSKLANVLGLEVRLVLKSAIEE